MAALSARKLLKELGGTLEVELQNAHLISPELCVISFIYEDKRYDDMFNITEEAKGILHDVGDGSLGRAGRMVRAALVADDSSDADGHPSVKSIAIVE